MTRSETKKFYNQDTKVYELNNNFQFLDWLEEQKNNGYNCFITIQELQELIDKISSWYEIKHLNIIKLLESKDKNNFKNIDYVSERLNIEQLLYRMTHNQLRLITCGYRSRNYKYYQSYKKGEIFYKQEITLRINRNDKEEGNITAKQPQNFYINADYITGKILKSWELKEYLDNCEDINLEELLSFFFFKYNNKLDLSELKESIYNHKIDMELRNKILQFIALKLLYSKHNNHSKNAILNPEIGYEIAKIFINEFNNYNELQFNLSTKEIDEILSKNYSPQDNKAKSRILSLLKK